jgi:hypothetical protein
MFDSDSGIITPSLALNSFLTYFGNPHAALRGAIVSVYQAGGMFFLISSVWSEADS